MKEIHHSATACPLAGAFDPGNAEARGERLGQALGGALLLVAIALSVALTIYGKLPGTTKTVAAASPVPGAAKLG